MQALTLNVLRQIINVLEKNPDEINKILSFHNSRDNEPKKFYLRKVYNRNGGYVYYVRYLDNGRLVPSNWSTGTDDYETARIFAIENREIKLAGYYNRELIKKPYIDLHMVLKKYYAEKSPYLQVDINKGRIVNEGARVVYHNFILNQFIPYLKKHGINDIQQIDTPLMSRFRNWIMTDRKVRGKIVKGVKPQTTKNKISVISCIFDHLVEEGYSKTNPCNGLTKIKAKQEDHKITGCYEVNKLKGVFNKKWDNQLFYMLNLIASTTNMRNSEIERIQVKDLILIDKYNFIDIPKSKSRNGERIVPLHPFVHKKIMAYVKKNNKGHEDYIFKAAGQKRLDSRVYNRACLALAKHTGYSVKKLKEENIRFYSNRHFWKTLMNSEGLGDDIEEIFMGHKVTSDVAKRYNHKDKHGRKNLLEKVKKVMAILDKCVFR